MPALVAGIHVLNACPLQKTWMAGTSPAMTATMLAADVCERTVGRYFCKFREAGIRRAITAASRRSNPDAMAVQNDAF